MKLSLLIVAASLALAACGGNGTTGGTSSSATAAESAAIARLDAIDAQQAGGALTREQAAQARLAVVHQLQAVEPSAVKTVKVPKSMAPPESSGKMQPEMTWFTAFLIVTRVIGLSGDTCPSCELADRPIDFGNGSGWD